MSEEATQSSATPSEVRYPYRAESETDQLRVNAAISEVLSSVEDMIYKLARRRLRGADDDTIDEVVQKCRLWLWQKSLPKFDAERGVKLTTYLWRCIINFLNQEVRAMARRARRQQGRLIDRDKLLEVQQGRSDRVDRQVEHLAQIIMGNPEQYLTANQSRVFRALMEADQGELMKDLAADLNYQRPSSLSMMKRRIRDRIAGIDIEGFNLEGA